VAFVVFLPGSNSFIINCLIGEGEILFTIKVSSTKIESHVFIINKQQMQTKKMQLISSQELYSKANEYLTQQTNKKQYSVLISSPLTLQRYGEQLLKGFKELHFEEYSVIRTIVLTLENSNHYQSVIDQYNNEETLVTIVQIHGCETEVPVFKYNYSGKLIFIIHRPEEFLLRFPDESDREYLHRADAIVIFNPSMISTYENVFPNQVTIAIPHGFFGIGKEIDTSLLQENVPVVVGSYTTWGEMRHLNDLYNLMKSLHTSNNDTNKRFIGYAAGIFQSKHEKLMEWKEKEDVWFVTDEELQKAHVHDSISAREYLYNNANNRMIIRVHQCDDPSIPTVTLHDWEKTFIDFNVQAYKEILNNNQPKVEASGTLHMDGGPSIGVVIDCSAMHDINNLENLQMIFLPWNTTTNNIDFEESAKRIIEHHDPHLRKKIVLENIENAAKKFGMKEIAFAYNTLMDQLFDV
jgi:hypothetical protein